MSEPLTTSPWPAMWAALVFVAGLAAIMMICARIVIYWRDRDD